MGSRNSLTSTGEESLTSPEVSAKPGSLSSQLQHQLWRIRATPAALGMSIHWPCTARGLGVQC